MEWEGNVKRAIWILGSERDIAGNKIVIFEGRKLKRVRKF